MQDRIFSKNLKYLPAQNPKNETRQNTKNNDEMLGAHTQDRNPRLISPITTKVGELPSITTAIEPASQPQQ